MHDAFPPEMYGLVEDIGWMGQIEVQRDAA